MATMAAGHLGSPGGTILAICLSTSHPDAFFQVSIGLSVQEKKKRKVDFQDGGMAAILDFRSKAL